MSPELANFLFEAANFLVLAAALGWVLFKPMRRALDAEQVRHRESRSDIDRQRSSLEKQRAELAGERDSFAAALEGTRTEALEAARREADELRQEAHKEMETERRALRQELAALEREELDSVMQGVGHLAAGTVERLMRQLAGPELDLSLVRSVVDELRGIAGVARVDSARALDSEARALLDAALPGGFQVAVQPELGAGLRITSTSGQIDVSALGFAREVRRTLPRELGRGYRDG